MNTIFHIYIIGIILLVIGGIIYLFLRHQRNLKSRAFLMQEAIRNGDYSFRLSTKGLLWRTSLAASPQRHGERHRQTGGAA